MKNCDRGLENAARGRRPRAAFSRPRSQFFTIRTDPKPVNNLFIFFLLGKKKNCKYCLAKCTRASNVESIATVKNDLCAAKQSKFSKVNSTHGTGHQKKSEK